MADSNVTEKWLPVVGYEGHYEISNFGQVRSIDRFITKSGKWKGHRYWVKGRLLHLNDHYGYLRVPLWKNHKLKDRYVHQLVLEAFIGPQPKGMECRHFPDPTRNNNKVGNLSWGTKLENAADRRKHGGYRCGEDSPTSKLKSADIENVFALQDDGKPVMQIVAITRISESHVRRILSGESWPHMYAKHRANKRPLNLMAGNVDKLM